MYACPFCVCFQLVITLARNMSECLFLYLIQTFCFLLISWVISSISKFDWVSFLMFKGHLRLPYFKLWIRSCNTSSIFLIAPHHLWNRAQTPEMAFLPSRLLSLTQYSKLPELLSVPRTLCSLLPLSAVSFIPGRMWLKTIVCQDSAPQGSPPYGLHLAFRSLWFFSL